MLALLFAFAMAFVALAAPPAHAGKASDAVWTDCHQRLDLDRGIDACTLILKLGDPRRGGALFNRGDLYSLKGDYDRAVADLNEAIRVAPEATEHYLYARGHIYIEKRDFDRAIADFNEGIRRSPEEEASYSGRAYAYSAKGDYDRAIADLNEAIRLEPDSSSKSGSTYTSEFYRRRGLAYAAKGDDDHAIADLNEAIRLYPPKLGLDFPPANYYADRSEIHARRNQFESALADADKAVSLGAKYPESAFSAYRAYVFGRMGQLDRAFAEIGEAYTHSPNSLDVLRFRGELHLMKGDARSALADFDAVFAKSPYNQFALAGRREAAKAALAVPPSPAAPSVTAAQPFIPPATPLGETRVALVIGNARYAAQSPLKNPLNDAGAIAGALRGAGFRKVVVAENLSRDALVKSLQAFQEEADRADWAVIYFSGHGVEIGGVNYVVPTDARLLTDRNAPDEAVSLDRLMASVGGAHKLRIVILDACRDNPFVASMRRTIASRSAGKGLAPVEPTRATLVVYAARDGQLAQDGSGENSPFAAALARRLGEPHVEVSKLFRLVTDDVLDATGHRQQPFVYGSLPGREDFYFRP